MPRVAVIGATGQIGRPLCRELLSAGYSVTVASRDPGRAARNVGGAAAYVALDPASAEFAGHLEAADAVVYLAGAPLFDGHKYDRADVEALSRARVAALGQLTAALGGLSRRPPTLIAASSVGYYGYAGSGAGRATGRADAPVDESCPAGTDWWGRDSESIERAALGARAHGVRTVLLRTGYVLTERSLAAQVTQFRKHFGGWIGSGRGWTPWIHIADEIGIIRFALEHPSLDGPLNLTAPRPVRGREFAAVLGRVLGRRAWLPVPSPMIRMGLGAVTDILSRGKRVVPAGAVAAGYEFRFPDLEAALLDLTGRDLMTAGAGR
jgi:uncharacterized protein (TIGR01777 family)